MPLKIEEISPENELQQNLEQLNIVDNNDYERDVDDNLRENEGEGESGNYDQGQDRKPTLEDNTSNEKKWKWSDETTRSEGGSHEIVSNVTNDNDKDVASSADESDFSLPKHRKDYPSDDERSDSEPFSNEEDEIDSEDSLISPSLSRAYDPYEQKTPPNTHPQVNGVSAPFEISPMSLDERPLQGDDDIDVSRIVNPIVRSISDLKSGLLAKLHYCPDPNLDGVKIDENWKHTEFEKSQDQHCYDSIVTAGKLLDIIMPMQLPEEAKERLAQARHILWEKSLLLSSSTSSTCNVNPTTAPDSTAEFVSSNVRNNKSSEENEQADSGEYNNQTSIGIDTKAKNQKSDDTISTKNESGSSNNATSSHKHRRGSAQGRKLRRHSTRGASAYSSPKSGRRNQNYSPRTPNARSPRIGSTVTSSIAGSATQASNRRFVGFLPSRCFTCGGIGHFANNCSNKGAYIATSTSNNQQLSYGRRRPNTNNRVVNNPTSNK